MARLEQGFDAVVGRFVNWLADDPLRHHNRLWTKPPAEEKAADTKDRIETVIDEATEERSTKKAPAAKVAPAKKAPAAKQAAPPGKATARKTDGLAKGEKALLEALTDLDGSASMRELVERTGETRYALTERLSKLQAEGLVERVGAGLKTRYKRIGP